MPYLVEHVVVTLPPVVLVHPMVIHEDPVSTPSRLPETSCVGVCVSIVTELKIRDSPPGIGGKVDTSGFIPIEERVLSFGIPLR